VSSSTIAESSKAKVLADPPADAVPTATPSAPPAPVVPDKRIKALVRFAASITIFNILGHTVLGFEQSPVTPIATALFAYVLELSLETIHARARHQAPRYAGGIRNLVTFLLPAHIAAMATAMLLWGSSLIWPYLFAVSVAITVKHVVKAPVAGRWRHTMNPSNTGIVATLLLFPWVGIAPPYMFTASVQQPIDWLLPLGILGAGTMLNVKLTGKAPLIMAWVGGFIVQAVLRSLLFDHSLAGALGPLTGVAVVLFTNYMITDPGTTPFARRGQVAFGLTCAAYYALLVTLHVSFGLFFALVATCLSRTVILHVIEARRRWTHPADPTVPVPAGGTS
jgi:Na+-translocating ferredoxin:NAD+ oxidoreductase RnfD subunit